MSRSRFHRAEARSVDPGGGLGGWNDSLSMTGVVPPHGWDTAQRAGVAVTPKTVLSIGVVQRCLEVIQNAFFVMGPPRAYRPSFDEDGMPYKSWILPTDRAYPGVLQSPWGVELFADNAAVTYSSGIGRTIVSMGLFGEAWWAITARDYYGNPTALQPLHPSFLDEKVVDGKLASITYGIGGQAVEIDPADLVHIPRLILPGDRQGLNPVKSEAPIFAIAIAAVQYSQMWFAQGGQASYILSTDEKLNPDDMDRIFEKIVLEHSGMNKAYMPLIFDSGVKPQVIQADPDRSQMNETLAYVRSEISGYFGIPQHLAGGTGDTGNVWGKGIQEQNYSLVDFTLSGYRVPIQDAFTQVIPRGQYANINEKQMLRANSADTAKAILAQRTAAVTMPDEDRRLLDLPPTGTPAGRDIQTPLNSNVPASPDATTSAVDGPDEDDNSGGSDG